MADKPDFFFLRTGKKLSDIRKKIPTAEQTVQKRLKQIKSNYDIRELGTGQEVIWLSEEEREANVHILGAPGEGKSKFLEDQIRSDIKAGNGLCLLDGSDAGQTCYDVLRYCASINHKKVVLIDPKTLSKFGKIAAVRLLDPKYQKLSLQAVFEAVNILFNTKSETDTPRIKRRLAALVRLLMVNGYTFSDTHYFSEYHQPKWREILNSIPPSRDQRTVQEEYTSKYHFENYFSSSINRLDAFWEQPLFTMFGYSNGINFRKMIKEGWVVLVNASPGLFATKTESALLGIIIISQILNAAEVLFQAPPQGIKKVFYLYVDEVGRFATEQIETVLSHSRKTGVRLILAHQHFAQIENLKVKNSIKQSARIKVMFNTPGYDDRLEMMKALGYGGDIPPLMASFANQDLPKQYAIIKKNKDSPQRVKIRDVPPVSVSKERLDNYIKELLKHEWYVPTRETTIYPKSSGPRTTPNRRAGSNPSVPDDRDEGNIWKTIPKNLPVSPKHAGKNDGTKRVKKPKV